MKKVGIGCLGIIVVLFIIMLIGAVAGVSKSTSTQQVSGQPGGTASNPGSGASAPAADLPTVGQTASKGGWQVTFVELGPYDQFATRAPSTPPQGKLVVVGFNAKNLQDKTSNFTSSDFQLIAADGRKFAPAGATGSIDKGFVVSQTVQPGLSTDNRLVFDVDPAVTDYTLQMLGLQFRASLE